jgi:hypothetical protein
MATKLAVSMQLPDVESSWNMIDKGGVAAVLFLGFIFMFAAFQFGWVVPAYVYKKLEKGETDWKTQAQGTLEGFKSLTEEVREIRRAAEARRGR